MDTESPVDPLVEARQKRLDFLSKLPLGELKAQYNKDKSAGTLTPGLSAVYQDLVNSAASERFGALPSKAIAEDVERGIATGELDESARELARPFFEAKFVEERGQTTGDKVKDFTSAAGGMLLGEAKAAGSLITGGGAALQDWYIRRGAGLPKTGEGLDASSVVLPFVSGAISGVKKIVDTTGLTGATPAEQEQAGRELLSAVELGTRQTAGLAKGLFDHEDDKDYAARGPAALRDIYERRLQEARPMAMAAAGRGQGPAFFLPDQPSQDAVAKATSGLDVALQKGSGGAGVAPEGKQGARPAETQAAVERFQRGFADEAPLSPGQRRDVEDVSIAADLTNLVPFGTGFKIGELGVQRGLVFLGEKAAGRGLERTAKFLAHAGDIAHSALETGPRQQTLAGRITTAEKALADEIAQTPALRQARIASGDKLVKLGQAIKDIGAKLPSGSKTGLAVASATALLNGGDAQEAFTAGVTAALGRKLIGSRLGVKAVGGATEAAGRVLQKPFIGPFKGAQEAVEAFRHEYRPVKSALVAAGLGAAEAGVLSLGADSAEEAGGIVGGAATLGAAGSMLGTVKAFGRDQLVKKAVGAGGVSAERPVAINPLGLNPTADAINADAVKKLSPAGTVFLSIFRKILPDQHVYVAMSDAEAQNIYSSVTGKSTDVSGVNGVHDVAPDGRQLVIIRPNGTGRGVTGEAGGHEVTHALQALGQSVPELKPLWDEVAAAAKSALPEGSVEFEEAKRDYEKKKEGLKLTPEQVWNEFIAEHGSVVLSGLPAGKLGGDKSVSTKLARAFLKLGEILGTRKVGLAYDGSGPVTSEALPYTPSMSLVEALERAFTASRLEASDLVPPAVPEKSAPAVPGPVSTDYAANNANAAPPAPRPATVDVGTLNPVPIELTTDRSLGTTTPPPEQPLPRRVAPVVDDTAPAAPGPSAPSVRGPEVEGARANLPVELTPEEKTRVAAAQPSEALRPVAEKVMSFIKALGGSRKGAPMLEVNYRDTETGKVFSKLMAPFRFDFNKTNNDVTVTAVDIDRVNYAAKLMFDWAAEKGQPDRFGYTGVNDPAFTKDLQTYLSNQAAGYRGGGGELRVGGEAAVTPGESPNKLPREKEQFFSMLMGVTPPVAETPRSIAAIARIRATAKAGGVEPLATETGSVEPNLLRDALRKEGAPVERIGEDPLAGRSQSNTKDRNAVAARYKLSGFESVKETGKRIDLPNTQAAEASFMPAEGGSFADDYRDYWLTPEGELRRVRASHEDDAAEILGRDVDDNDITKNSEELHRKKWLRVKSSGDELYTSGLPTQQPTAAQRKVLQERADGGQEVLYDHGRGTRVLFSAVRPPEGRFMPAATQRPQASAQDFSKDSVKDLPNKRGWAIFTAENPKSYKDRGVDASPEENARRNAKLQQDLEDQGLEHIPVKGKYDKPENSFIVLDPDMSIDRAAALARKYDQESIFTPYGLVYQDGSVEPLKGIQTFDTKPENYFTEHDGHYFSGDIDFSKRIAPDSVEGQTLRAEDALEAAGKSDAASNFMPAKALERERVKDKDVQFKTKTKEGSVGGVLELVHFSSKNITEIDPKKSFGKGAATPTDLQGEPKAFFYVKGTAYEAPIATRPNVYTAKIDGNALYDYNKDVLGVRSIVNREKRDAAIQKAGFVGYYVETPGFDAVAVFDKTKVRPVLATDVMNRRQLVDTGRAEATPQDLRQFAKEDLQNAREEQAREREEARLRAQIQKSPAYKQEAKRLAASGVDDFTFEFGKRMDDWVDEQVQKKLGDGARFMPVSTVPIMKGEETFAPKGTGINEIISSLADRSRKEARIPHDSRTPKAKRAIAETLADEIGYAVEQDNSAIGWYDRKIKEAMSTLADVHPEIETNPDKAAFFKAILAVTSNGQDVIANFSRADELYSKWKQTGRLETTGEFGGARKNSINQGLEFLQKMQDEFGLAGTREFLTTRFRFGDLKKVVKEKLGKNLGSAEAVDYEAPGSLLLGPKVGGGFFPNLMGDFSPVTMDLWLMRTWNRINGSYGQRDAAKVAKKVEAIKALAPTVDDPDAAAVAKMSDRQIINWAAKRHAEWAKKQFKDPKPLDRPAKRLDEEYQGVVESPRNSGERAWVREVFKEVDKVLAERGLPAITNADKQALLWYYEKNLATKLGYKSTRGQPADYADGARAVLERRRGGAIASRTPDGGEGTFEDEAGAED